MTAEELAKELDIPRRTLFWMRKRYTGAPPSFDDVSGWRTFIEANKSSTIPKVTKRKPSAAGGESGPRPVTDSNFDYVEARARKTQIQAEMAMIQLEATKRNIIPKEEVKSLFAKIGAVVRGRFLKVKADLPCTCVGLSEVQIEKVLDEKIEYALSALDIPNEFFEPQSAV